MGVLRCVITVPVAATLETVVESTSPTVTFFVSYLTQIGRAQHLWLATNIARFSSQNHLTPG